VVYEPAYSLVTDVVPCEDGHAQERALFKTVWRTAQAGDLWRADRNFCTRASCSLLSTSRGPFSSSTLVVLAQHVRLEALRKSPTRARTTRSKPPRTPKEGHGATARLLQNRKAHSNTP
jgi:hypothetical protein